MTILKEVDALLEERQTRYGDMVKSWREIAERVSARRGKDLSAEDVLWVLIEMKLERDRHSPDNDDHLRDAIGYLGILFEVRFSAEASEPPAKEPLLISPAPQFFASRDVANAISESNDERVRRAKALGRCVELVQVFDADSDEHVATSPCWQLPPEWTCPHKKAP